MTTDQALFLTKCRVSRTFLSGYILPILVNLKDSNGILPSFVIKKKRSRQLMV